MHGMIGMTELLLHTNLSAQQQQFAKAAHNSGEALLNLINEILDFSKVEASKIEIDEIAFDVVDLIDEICYLQGEPADRKGLKLNGIFTNATAETLIGDPTKIRQVVMNLVSNSIKFTHAGNVNVRVAFEEGIAQGPAKSTLSIVVEDQGIGMDADTQAKVFDAFTQADASTTREYGGTGLGLAISKHYIELMDGNIEISSQPDIGTKIAVKIPVTIDRYRDLAAHSSNFDKAVIDASNDSTYDMISSHFELLGVTTSRIDFEKLCDSDSSIFVIDYDTQEFNQKILELSQIKGNRIGIITTPLTRTAIPEYCRDWICVTKPLTLASLKSATEEVSRRDGSFASQPLSENREFKLKRILVAEDVETNQQIAQEMISMLGYQVDIAANGSEALKKLEEYHFDLIFMDCQMPIMDGYEATHRIREIEAKENSERVPIVALTAGFNKGDREKCKDAGMDFYLTKPFSVSDIRGVLERFFGKAKICSDDHSMQRGNEENEFFLEPENTSEIFSISAIENIREVEKQTGRSLLPSIFQGFVNQMEEKLSEINSHIESGDSIALYRTAHAIKSMSANIGAERVRAISSQIETAGRDNKLANLQKFVNELDHGYCEFKEAFESEFFK
jgi:CheY-like chemotaxis protein/HPt (histidine-containing phosphotransfer) domain-containing protein/anti-sigma regulatory factor (Ser/Thr protein kinase)